MPPSTDLLLQFQGGTELPYGNSHIFSNYCKSWWDKVDLSTEASIYTKMYNNTFRGNYVDKGVYDIRWKEKEVLNDK